MDRIEGKECPLCKERRRVHPGRLEQAANDPILPILYKCSIEPRHFFLYDGTNLIVQDSDKEEDKGIKFPI